MTKAEAERVVESHWPGWAGLAEKQGSDFVVQLWRLASDPALTVVVDSMPDESHRGRSSTSYEEAMGELAKKIPCIANRAAPLPLARGCHDDVE